MTTVLKQHLRSIVRESDFSARTGPTRGVEAWVVWFNRVHLLFAIAAPLLFVLTCITGPRDPEHLAILAGLLLLLGWWTHFCLFQDRGDAVGNQFRSGPFLIGALPLYIALGVIEPNFQTLLFLAYWQMFSLLALPVAIAVVALFTIANVWAQNGFTGRFPIDSPGGWSLFVGTIVISGVLATFISSIIRQSAQRQELVEELEAARRDLAASERNAGVMGERQRIAGEVHDTIAQDFASIVLQLEAAESRLGPNESVSPNIALAKQIARNGLTESRRIVLALRPEILNGTTLQYALEQHSARWSRETQIDHGFFVSGDRANLPRDVEVVVFRGLQESLTNVRKHASATRVNVTLTWLDDEVILDVRDNGEGFDVETAHGGVGLTMMQERVATVGGRVAIETAPGEGTTVSVAVSYEREHEVCSDA